LKLFREKIIYSGIDIEIYAEDLYLLPDEGTGFGTADIESRRTRRGLPENRGRGIYLIKQFCKISRNKKGNRFNLKIKRKGRS
jgi:hypothetical protein